MIFDRLDNYRQYGALPSGIAAAIDFLRSADFQLLAEGRHEIDGDRLVAIVQRYRTRPAAEAVWEAHRRHIDVQYVLEGAERMGHLLLRDGLTVKRPYDGQQDAILFDAQGSLIEAGPGDVAVFFPQDVHAPGLAAGAPMEVRKVVVKCLCE